MTARTLLTPGDTDVAPRWPTLRRLRTLAPFIASQIIILIVMFQVYKMARKTFIGRAEKVAYDHAHDVIALEEKLHLHFEQGLQHWILERPEWVIRAFNQFYANYMWVFYVLMGLSMFFAVERWRYLRRWFYISMMIATPWYLIYPLAPPRFMTEYGYLDTLAIYGPNYFSDNGFVTANRYAAMPSMHVGWTTLAAIVFAMCLPWRRIGVAIAAFLIVAIAVTVMVTGNHYWLDAVAGWFVISLAAVVNRLLPYPLPIRWPWQRGSGPTAMPSPAREPASALPE